MIGDNVQVVILGVKGNQFRIGISAPQAVKIFRQEVYDRIQACKDQSLVNTDVLEIEEQT